jgi:hypothetical protein
VGTHRHQAQRKDEVKSPREEGRKGNRKRQERGGRAGRKEAETEREEKDPTGDPGRCALGLGEGNKRGKKAKKIPDCLHAGSQRAARQALTSTDVSRAGKGHLRWRLTNRPGRLDRSGEY